MDSLHGHRRKRACQLYTAPLLSTVLPVYTDVSLTWNPACVQVASTVDLYLSVLRADGLRAVHEWTGVSYAGGLLKTQLKPSWWNATTGAGAVQAQVRTRSHAYSANNCSSPSPPPAGPSGTPLPQQAPSLQLHTMAREFSLPPSRPCVG